MLKLLAVALLIAGPAFGSGDDAWSAFATEVENACLAAVGNTLGDALAVVDHFGSETYGMAIITGRTVNDRTTSMICVMDKGTRTVQIGSELEIAVTRTGLQPLSEHDIENEGLAGELFCSFEADIGTLLLAAGYVASDQPAEAAVKPSSQVMKLGASGGFDAIITGAVFSSRSNSATVEVTGNSTEGGESPPLPATLTVKSEGMTELTAIGFWRCGP